MRLRIDSLVPDRGPRISLYECENSVADGMISYRPIDQSSRMKRSFCFDSPHGPNYGEIAQVSHPDTVFEVCVLRETGFCESGDCMSVFLFDQCATFDGVVNCSDSLDCPIFESKIREVALPSRDEREPAMDLIHEVKPVKKTSSDRLNH